MFLQTGGSRKSDFIDELSKAALALLPWLTYLELLVPQPRCLARRGLAMTTNITAAMF
ncbi:hypothetical protein [Thauera sp. WB-2]|uniref:hypothetical protein n=1 Tax=Thauera sp. WB-2 TaxID=2897772 RepID=UPI0022DD16BE|nr:hypothetical protein [Thauera sp. WB-2]WBL65790.1 hypothetical protein LQF09_08300 [Thauera sp. WB-2]